MFIFFSKCRNNFLSLVQIGHWWHHACTHILAGPRRGMLNAINTITGRVSGPRAAAAAGAGKKATPTHRRNTKHHRPPPSAFCRLPSHHRPTTTRSPGGPLLSIQFNCFAFLRKCPAITARPVCQPLVYLFGCLYVGLPLKAPRPQPIFIATVYPRLQAHSRNLNCCLFVTHPHGDFPAMAK